MSSGLVICDKCNAPVQYLYCCKDKDARILLLCSDCAKREGYNSSNNWNLSD